ncbi:hypothetical protein [Fusibacter sp. JL216-2]|uniref:hypothetical protein n=1 Tax=Fusibacter sp. JL216-2 TaxID=3071453 RepID=UPI003D33DD5F
MWKNIKASLPLWLAITAYLCYADAFFNVENLLYFAKQFIIVALAGCIMAFLYEYFVDWICEKRSKWFRRLAFRILIYGLVNVFAVEIVLLGYYLSFFDVSYESFVDFSPSFIQSAGLVLVITAIYHIYHTYKFRMALDTKQENI